MSLNFGRQQLAIPGPSVIPDRVLSAMHRPSPDIYEGELVEISTRVFADLKAVARTKENCAVYISNGHGAWEAALRNTFAEGDEVLVLATGRFAAGWAELARSLGLKTEVIDFGMTADADPNRLEEILRADTGRRFKAVMVVQTDTASSVRNDIPALRKAIDDAGHDALFAVDCIASLGCEPFEMDRWGVDLMVTACQKGLMTPAGMSFVFFGDRCVEARKRARPGGYWDWVPRADPQVFYQYFGGTPPTHHLFGLHEALTMLVHEEGIEQAWRRHETLAQAYWAAIDAWGEGDAMTHNIRDRAKRSRAVSAVVTPAGCARRIRAWTKQEAGVTLGVALGFGQEGDLEYDRRFRIGHMGHQNLPMTFGVIGAIDAAMKALGIGHGRGALEAASAVLAAHGQGA